MDSHDPKSSSSDSHSSLPPSAQALIERAQHIAERIHGAIERHPVHPFVTQATETAAVIRDLVAALAAQEAVKATVEQERDKYRELYEVRGVYWDANKAAAAGVGITFELHHGVVDDHWEKRVAAEAQLAAQEAREQQIMAGLKAILTAARGDEKGECWTIRRWLDAQDVFTDDIEGPQRLIEEACKVLVSRSSPRPATEPTT